jgi:hypothetical protein
MAFDDHSTFYSYLFNFLRGFFTTFLRALEAVEGSTDSDDSESSESLGKETFFNRKALLFPRNGIQ